MCLVEEYLFFKHYCFHKQKIAFHRATMRRYADFLREDKKREVHYIEATEAISDILNSFTNPDFKKLKR